MGSNTKAALSVKIANESAVLMLFFDNNYNSGGMLDFVPE